MSGTNGIQLSALIAEKESHAKKNLTQRRQDNKEKKQR